MSRVAGVAGVGLVLLMVMLLARWNGAEQVTLDLGLWTFYRVPLTYVAFGSLFVGMLVMLLAGLHADLRVRRYLRERLAEEDREERRRTIDINQRDLFANHPLESHVERESHEGPRRREGREGRANEAPDPREGHRSGLPSDDGHDVLRSPPPSPRTE